MEIKVHAIGKATKGPWEVLNKHYLERYNLAARQMGWRPLVLNVKQIRPARADKEREWLNAQVPEADYMVALDERGDVLTSQQFATFLTQQHNQGYVRMHFVMGGAEGLGDSLRKRAHKMLCFGSLTWPHELARVMLLEQLYRSLTIHAGHPYHKEG